MPEKAGRFYSQAGARASLSREDPAGIVDGVERSGGGKAEGGGANRGDAALSIGP